MATPPVFSAGAVLTAAQMNAVGLWLVKTQSIGTAVSNVTVSSCFSSDFDNYFVRISGTSATVDNSSMALQLKSGSSSPAATNYSYIYHYVNYATATPGVVAGSGTTSISYVGRTYNNRLTVAVDISEPFIAARTGFRALTPGGNVAGPLTGYHDVATSYDSMYLFLDAGTMTGGNVYVYGYRI